MFDRFEDDCKKALNLARQEAQRLGHSSIRPEHTLLGLLRVESCTAVELLRKAGGDPEQVLERLRAELARDVRSPDMDVTHMPFTPSVKRMLELSMQAATDLHDSYVGTEHLLLGAAMLAERGGWETGGELLGISQAAIAGALDGVRRGPARDTRGARANSGEASVAAACSAALSADPRELLHHAAALCDNAKEMFIRYQDFERASRTRDLAFWLRQLADEQQTKRAEGS